MARPCSVRPGNWKMVSAGLGGPLPGIANLYLQNFSTIILSAMEFYGSPWNDVVDLLILIWEI